MIYVQQAALGTLEHDVFTGFASGVQQIGDVSDHGLDLITERKRLSQHRVVVYRFYPVVLGERKIVVIDYGTQLLRKCTRINKSPKRKPRRATLSS